MMDPMNDPAELLVTLAECLCAQIRSEGLPRPCFCGVIHGESAAADYMGDCTEDYNGMAWVRLNLLYPASGVNVINETAGNCSAGIGMDIEVGILRRAPLPDDDGTMPSEADHLEAATLGTRDAMAMWRAIACCPALPDSKAYTMGSYTPVGPMGDGSLGGTWSLAVML